MKGVVFTEYLDFVASVAGDEVVDDMIDAADLPSGGVYTAVGKYDYREMVALVTELSKILDQPASDLVRAFGRHLFGRFAEGYPAFFEAPKDAFEFIETIEGHIHVEVRKLYPDAELPTLDARRVSDSRLTVEYASCRPFGDLCIGLIEGCADHYGEKVTIQHAPRENGLSLIVERVDAVAA